MKPFLGIDLTTDKKNEIANGDEFITKTPSAALTQAMERAGENAEQLLQHAKLPLIVRVVGWIFVVLVVSLIGGIFEAWSETEGLTFAAMYADLPWLFWCAGAAVVGAALFWLLAHWRYRKTVESDEGEMTFDAVSRTADSIAADLGVPSDAVEIDLLSFPYKLKKGEPVHHAPFAPERAYLTLIFSAYRDGENLCLTNNEGVHTFPLSELRCIQTVKKSILTDDWNKDEAHNKGIYKPYKIRENDDGNYISNPYYILHLEHAGEEWGIYFPCYELPTIERLTGLTAQQA